MSNLFYKDNSLPNPNFEEFFYKDLVKKMSVHASAHYLKKDSSSLTTVIPLGSMISPSIYRSPYHVFESAVFTNSVSQIDVLDVVDNGYLRILQNCDLYHDVIIHYSIKKQDETNFSNTRNIRATLVNQDGIAYKETIKDNKQTDSSERDLLMLKGHINHGRDDTVYIMMYVVQDTTDPSDTLVNIFKISWSIRGLV
jgi:hypothetical protein